MARPALSVLLALVCSVQVPAFAQGSFSPPQDVEVRAKALFDAGGPLEAAQVYAQALNGLPEGPDTRDQRNAWATKAVNAYTYAFKLDTAQCATSHAGLALADAYLAGLFEAYGDQAKDSDDHAGMREARDRLEEARAQTGCLPPASASVPAPVSEGPREDPAGAAGTDATAPRRRGPGLAVGVGVSAALSVGMAIGTGVLYSRLRKNGGYLYGDIQEHAEPPPGTIGEYDMCEEPSGELETACNAWDSQHKAFLATAVLTGVFAASTAVFTGLLIRQRRQPGPAAALLRRHQARLGATPHLGGGASLTAGFHF